MKRVFGVIGRVLRIFLIAYAVFLVTQKVIGYLVSAARTRNRPQGIITTVVGDGHMGDSDFGSDFGRFAGDGGLATKASLNCPWDVAVGPNGSLYIADTFNNRIRKVDPQGIITTVAGDGWADENGTGRCAGDGGPATKASLKGPCAVAMAADGSLYIVDGDQDRVRKVGPKGIITAVDRGGMWCVQGWEAFVRLSLLEDVASGPDGSVYIADASRERVFQVLGTGMLRVAAGSGHRGFSGDGGLAVEASLHRPRALAVGADGSIYIADTGNNRVRRVDPKGIITTVAGDGSSRGRDLFLNIDYEGMPATHAGVPGPSGLAVDSRGNLYISSRAQVKVVTRKGILYTVTGSGRERGFSGDGGPAIEAELWAASGLAVGQDGSLYIADLFNHRIRKVTWKR